MDRMLTDFPDTFTAIQMHTGGAGPVTAWGNTRRTFYVITGIPCAEFDGVDEARGAYSNVDTQYNWYKAKYQSRLIIASDLSLELGGEEVSSQTYEVKVRVTNADDGDEHGVRVHIVRLLDHYPTYGGYHRNCCMEGAAYEEITLQPGESTVITRQFTFDATSWANQDDIKIVAFAQDIASIRPARVHNAVVMDWPFTPLQEYELGDLNCDDHIDGFDIDAFIMVMEDEAPYDTYYANYPDCDHTLADCNGDGHIDGFDIGAFIDILNAGG
ncbi:MAG: hypothetical protein KKB50_20805 [Planctomycetes bacterium]|nr:hypothetical protein [Planctomycetota bacterium]